MALDLLAKFSVVKQVDTTDGLDLYDVFLDEEEIFELSYSHKRDNETFCKKCGKKKPEKDLNQDLQNNIKV